MAKAQPSGRKEKIAAIEREQKMKRGIVYTIIGLVILVVVGVITFVVVSAIQDSQKPENNLSADTYSISFGPTSAKVTVDVYFDFICPGCGTFERTNGPDLETLAEAGTIRLNMHPMNFGDTWGAGTNFSSRAANAFVTVANKQPEKALQFAQAIFENQPTENQEDTMLTDEQLADLAVRSGVSQEVADTFTANEYADWVDKSNEAAGQAGLASTPGLQINGEWIMGSADSDSANVPFDYSKAGELKSYLENLAK
ncbi:MAG: DsbA family protein [Propionibacteriaceae bacterium]|jgi:protein-disulfide isomerase|nr:DsbA family protein [Propionibacteriaceae bacterium]